MEKVADDPLPEKDMMPVAEIFEDMNSNKDEANDVKEADKGGRMCS